MRRVKILATIGPASRSPERLRELLEAGADAVRLNMSHGTQGEHAAVIAAVRRLSAELARPVAIVLDLQGPKIRTGPLGGGAPVRLETGASFTITSRPVRGDARCVSTTFADLARDLRAGDTILLADGLIELCVESTTDTDAATRVVHGGMRGEHIASSSAPLPTSRSRRWPRRCWRLGTAHRAISWRSWGACR